jgi:glycerol-3-phosphate acyltransferase PlsY
MGLQVAPVYIGLTGLLAAFVLLTHRHNIGRLLTGTENRFSLGSRSSGGGELNG